MKIYELDYSDKSMEVGEETLSEAFPKPYSIGKAVKDPFPIQKFKVHKKGKYSDFIYYGRATPIFSNKAIEAVIDLLGKNVQLLDIELVNSDVECKILNVLNIEDAVDFSRTTAHRAGARDKIVGFIKLVLLEDKVKNEHIFKIPELSNRVYVSEEFKNRILSAKPKLKGFEFHEVWDSSFTVEMEQAQQAKYESILCVIEQSTSPRYTFTEAIEQMKHGKAFACKQFKLQIEPPGMLHILHLKQDGTYSNQSAGYIPPVLLQYMWVEVERELNIS